MSLRIFGITPGYGSLAGNLGLKPAFYRVADPVKWQRAGEIARSLCTGNVALILPAGLNPGNIQLAAALISDRGPDFCQLGTIGWRGAVNPDARVCWPQLGEFVPKIEDDSLKPYLDPATDEGAWGYFQIQDPGGHLTILYIPYAKNPTCVAAAPSVEGRITIHVSKKQEYQLEINPVWGLGEVKERIKTRANGDRVLVRTIHDNNEKLVLTYPADGSPPVYKLRVKRRGQAKDQAGQLKKIMIELKIDFQGGDQGSKFDQEGRVLKEKNGRAFYWKIPVVDGILRRGRLTVWEDQPDGRQVKVYEKYLDKNFIVYHDINQWQKIYLDESTIDTWDWAWFHLKDKNNGSYTVVLAEVCPGIYYNKDVLPSSNFLFRFLNDLLRPWGERQTEPHLIVHHNGRLIHRSIAQAKFERTGFEKNPDGTYYYRDLRVTTPEGIEIVLEQKKAVDARVLLDHLPNLFRNLILFFARRRAKDSPPWYLRRTSYVRSARLSDPAGRIVELETTPRTIGLHETMAVCSFFRTPLYYLSLAKIYGRALRGLVKKHRKGYN